MRKEKVYELTAKYKDFDKDGGDMIMWTNCDEKVTAWKLAFYELWRYQMTWNPCYKLEVIDGKENLFVRAVVKVAFVEPMIKTMEGVGYRNISKNDSYVGIVDVLKVPDDVYDIEIGLD